MHHSCMQPAPPSLCGIRRLRAATAPRGAAPGTGGHCRPHATSPSHPIIFAHPSNAPDSRHGWHGSGNHASATAVRRSKLLLLQISPPSHRDPHAPSLANIAVSRSDPKRRRPAQLAYKYSPCQPARPGPRAGGWCPAAVRGNPFGNRPSLGTIGGYRTRPQTHQNNLSTYPATGREAKILL